MRLETSDLGCRARQHAAVGRCAKKAKTRALSTPSKARSNKTKSLLGVVPPVMDFENKQLVDHTICVPKWSSDLLRVLSQSEFDV